MERVMETESGEAFGWQEANHGGMQQVGKRLIKLLE
jgi:hypothetical protein